MTNETTFRILAGIVFITMFAVSIYYRSRADREGGELDKSQGQDFLKVIRLIALLILLPLFAYFINPDWVSWARFVLPDWVRWTAVVFAFALIPVFVWIFRSIGTGISPTEATRQSHQLVTHGPYLYVRHPLYTAGVLVYLALTAITAMWWIAATMLPVVAVLMIYRTPKEEANLIAEFGDHYRQYMAQTGRYLPKLG